MSLWCKHDWIIIDKEILPSGYKQWPLSNAEGIGSWFFKNKYICIIQCKKCGKLNKTVEINP